MAVKTKERKKAGSEPTVASKPQTVPQSPTKPPAEVKAPAVQPAAASPKIDFPQNGELLRTTHYAIRISADEGAEAEVTLDGKQWMPCRFAVGHWWFDWQPTGRGEQKLKARARVNGKWKTSDIVVCQVDRN